MFSSFVRPDADVVVLDHSINDGFFEFVPRTDVNESTLLRDAAMYQAFMFDLFMEQVVLHPRQPRVVLLYWWGLPLSPHGRSHRIPPHQNWMRNTEFWDPVKTGWSMEQIVHERAAAHPLVLKQIDAAAFIRRACLMTPVRPCETGWFLDDDGVHPLAGMQAWVAGELKAALNELALSRTVPRSPPAMPPSWTMPRKRVWHCQSEESKQVWSSVLEGPTRTLSWTAYVPSLAERQTLRLASTHDTTPEVTKPVNKSVVRHDRKQQVHVPLCSEGELNLTTTDCASPRGFVWSGSSIDRLTWSVPRFNITLRDLSSAGRCRNAAAFGDGGFLHFAKWGILAPLVDPDATSRANEKIGGRGDELLTLSLCARSQHEGHPRNTVLRGSLEFVSLFCAA